MNAEEQRRQERAHAVWQAARTPCAAALCLALTALNLLAWWPDWKPAGLFLAGALTGLAVWLALPERW